MRHETDIAIVGSGFAGSLTALALRRVGRSVTLIERGRHPRFAIGESSTPLANLLVEQLCDTYGLETVRPLAKYGTWQRTYPDIACGLKRGFSFYHHAPGQPFADDEGHARQLLVAASPHDDIADMHWYRPHVDAFLARQAQEAGAAYFDDTVLSKMDAGASAITLSGERRGQPFSVRAAFVIDASGPRGFMHRVLGLTEVPLRWLPGTQTLYAHFEDVDLWQDVVKDDDDGIPPFPVDAAALHHVFPGGWLWVLRFNNGVTSAGAAVTDGTAASVGLRDGAAAWSRVLDRLPSVRVQFARARAVTAFTYAPRLAYRSPVVTGRRWAQLPSAAGVIDPLLSTGFPLTLLGVHRLAGILERHWERPGLDAALLEYSRQTTRELETTEALVAALYAAMGDFELFKRLSLLYFAAAAFSEAARRLGHPERAPGFLLCGHPAFARELRECCAQAARRPDGRERAALLSRIDRAIEPFDVAGLRDRGRRDWYPVRADDVIAAAPKLGATPGELHALLARCGFGEPVTEALDR